ncbi:pentapeptide repeat-containing protein [Ferrimonas balearica]|uniref:pentapeptide repeat-containing protein n=1 Tax=Ferrimonas balearica TaxID=44012 RepID=UPI001C994314|nr:pentapeptide repeat-containing protein [Ferrimonas balearica]MBY5993545.1 pentapeptide repeat-containing protein [Ferrimonas balearica]
MTRAHCRYRTPNGTPCPRAANASGFCYWHDAGAPKTHPDDAAKLGREAQGQGILVGLKLRKATLRGVNLVRPQGADLSHSDCYRADLRDAHLYRVNLSHCDLMKADLRGANLNRANLDGANLLGLKLEGARIEQLHLGRALWQQCQARTEKDPVVRQDLYQQAEEIYRDLRRAAQAHGCAQLASTCAHRELTMRRKQMPRHSPQRWLSKLVDLACGYGEAPLRVVSFALSVMVFCALLFLVGGFIDDGALKRLDQANSLREALHLAASSLYYSVITFTTLGYGDIAPAPGFSRFVAALEALTGSFTLALFVVVFAKKMTR